MMMTSLSRQQKENQGDVLKLGFNTQKEPEKILSLVTPIEEMRRPIYEETLNHMKMYGSLQCYYRTNEPIRGL